MTKLATLKKTNLYELAIDSLLNYIIVNDLKDGDKLPPENQLKDLFGISRNTLREALKSLQTIGIIETKQNLGIVIKNFQISDLTKFVPYSLRVKDKDLKNLSEARELLEQAVLPLVVERRTEEDLEKLNKVIRDIDIQIIEGKDINELDFLFHQTLVECCGNPFLNNINIIFKEFFSLYRRETLLTNVEVTKEGYHYASDVATNNEHKLILKYVQEKNLPMLQKIHRKHLYILFVPRSAATANREEQ